VINFCFNRREFGYCRKAISRSSQTSTTSNLDLNLANFTKPTLRNGKNFNVCRQQKRLQILISG
jgi:hypothetical protein